jgi:2-C-methyl-D-erythritol 4-phosphate cytidylyltransferase
LAPFLADERCRAIVVAISPEDRWFEHLALSRHPRVSTVSGGKERGDSVRLALQGLPAEDSDWVLVHDAARPCVSAAEIDALLDSVTAEEVGALLAVPVADTIKRCEQGRATRTEERATLWRALTPQMFRFGILRSALAAANSAGRIPTDESQAVEWLGHQPRLVRGSVRNIKVTEPGDLALAEFMLGQGNPGT